MPKVLASHLTYVVVAAYWSSPSKPGVSIQYTGPDRTLAVIEFDRLVKRATGSDDENADTEIRMETWKGGSELRRFAKTWEAPSKWESM